MESTSQETTVLSVAPDGRAEVDPVPLAQAVMRCLDKTLAYARTNPQTASKKIAAWGTSCFWHSVLATDAHGTPLSPIYTWADSRCRDAAAALRSRYPEKKIHARTGCMLRSSYWPAKLRWLAAVKPKLFKSALYWLSPGEWLLWKLGLPLQTSVSMASGTGLLDVHKLRWDPEMLQLCGIRAEQLAPLNDFPSPSKPNPSHLLPELRESACFPAIGDGAASNLGSDATTESLAAINIGTSAAVRVVLDRKKIAVPSGLFLYRVDSDRYLLGGAISNAGNIREWCLRQLALSQNMSPEKLWANLPNANLTVLPFWINERAPTWPENIPAAILGLTAATTAADIYQAVTDASYLRLAQIADLLPKPPRQPMKFIVSGGIVKSPQLLGRLANALNKSLIVSTESEASLRGAAVFALTKTGYAPAPLSSESTVAPDKTAAAAFAAAGKRQMALEKLVTQFSHSIKNFV